MTPFDRNEAIERFIGKCLGMPAYEFCSDPVHLTQALWAARHKTGLIFLSVYTPQRTAEKLAGRLAALDWPEFADDAEFQGLLEYMRETLK